MLRKTSSLEKLFPRVASIFFIEGVAIVFLFLITTKYQLKFILIVCLEKVNTTNCISGQTIEGLFVCNQTNECL